MLDDVLGEYGHSAEQKEGDCSSLPLLAKHGKQPRVCQRNVRIKGNTIARTSTSFVGHSLSQSNMNITYNVSMTLSAIRRHSFDLSQKLVETHRIFDPSIPQNAIKIITQYLRSEDTAIHIGGSNADYVGYSYIGVTIDIPAGSKTAEEKKTLMTLVSSSCLKYQQKKAEHCEIEIRINEVDLDNVMLAGRRSVSAVV